MSSNNVVIKLSLEGADSVSAGLKGVGTSAGEANSRLGSLVSTGLKGAGAAFVGLAAAATAAGAALVTSGVKHFAEYEQNIGGIETMFKDSANKMKAYADQAYKTAGLSANEYMSQVTSFSAALLQGLHGDTAAAAEVANKAMIDMSDNANKFGTDISLLQNAYQGFAKQNYTMLDNLKLGYGGTKEEMARLINESGVLGETMKVTAQTVDDVSFDKIIEAIHVVQERLGIAGTTALEAATTISGAAGMLSASWANLLTHMANGSENIHTYLGAVVESFAALVSNITPAVQNISDSFANMAPELPKVFSVMLESLVNMVPAIISVGNSLIVGFLEGIRNSIPALLSATNEITSGLVSLVETAVPLLFDAGLNVVSSLAKGIGYSLPTLLPKISETIRATVTDGIIPNIPDFIRAGTALIFGLLDGVIASLPSLLEAFLSLSEGILNGLLGAIPLIVQFIPKLITGITSFLTASIPLVMEALVSLFTGIISELPVIIEMIVGALPALIEGVVGFFVQNVPVIVDGFVSLLTAIVDNLPLVIETIVAALPSIIDAIVTGLIEMVPILVESGITLLTALIEDLPTIITTLVSALPEIIDSIVTGLLSHIDTLVMAGFQLLVALVQNMPGIISTLVGKMPEIITAIFNAVIGGISDIGNAGYQLITGLWDGILSAKDWLLDKISGFVDDVVGGIKNFFGIHSPSRVFRDEVGRWLPRGLAVGIEADASKAVSAVNSLGKQILVEANNIPIPKINFSTPATSYPTRITPTTNAVATRLSPSVVYTQQGEPSTQAPSQVNIDMKIDVKELESIRTVEEFVNRATQWSFLAGV